MTILTIMLFLSGTAKAVVTYRTPELKRLALVAGVKEQELKPGVNFSGKHTIMMDDNMTVRHVGITLFSEEIKQIGDRLILEFVERYFLQLEHPAPNSTATLMIHSDGISFPKGRWQDIKKVGPNTPFNIDYHLMRYTLSWKYQLICGENLPQAEEHLLHDITHTAPGTHAEASLGEMEPSSMKGYYLKRGAWYHIEALNGTTFYQMQSDSTLVPVVDPDFIEESVADIMMCPDVAESFTLDIIMHRYGFHESQVSVPLRQWVDYCVQMGCEIFCGIEEVSAEMAKATVLAVNTKLNFNHLLTVSVPIEAIDNGKGTVKGDLHAFIPTHNVINDNAKYKNNKKIENRILRNI